MLLRAFALAVVSLSCLLVGWLAVRKTGCWTKHVVGATDSTTTYSGKVAVSGPYGLAFVDHALPCHRAFAKK